MGGSMESPGQALGVGEGGRQNYLEAKGVWEW